MRSTILKTMAIATIVGGAWSMSACAPAEPLPADAASQMSEAPTEAPSKAPAPAAKPKAAAPKPKANTCDVAREALLTGTHAQKVAAMKALQSDRAQDADAREAAKGWLKYDGKDKDMQGMYESTLEMYCSIKG